MDRAELIHRSGRCILEILSIENDTTATEPDDPFTVMVVGSAAQDFVGILEDAENDIGPIIQGCLGVVTVLLEELAEIGPETRSEILGRLSQEWAS